MANKSEQNAMKIDNDVDDINQDVNQLADTLEEVLKSFGSDASDEVDKARAKAEKLLKETRAKMGGRGRIQKAAHDAVDYTDGWVHEKPWYSIAVGAAVGLVIGALLGSRR